MVDAGFPLRQLEEVDQISLRPPEVEFIPPPRIDLDDYFANRAHSIDRVNKLGEPPNKRLERSNPCRHGPCTGPASMAAVV
jgi:hypothetical protein